MHRRHMLHFWQTNSQSGAQDVIASLKEGSQAGSADVGDVRDDANSGDAQIPEDAENTGDAKTVRDVEPVEDVGTERDSTEGFSSILGQVESNEPTMDRATKKTITKMCLVLPVACSCYFLSQGVQSVCGASSSTCQYSIALLHFLSIGVLVDFVLTATLGIAKWHQLRKKTSHGSGHDLDEQQGHKLAQHDQQDDVDKIAAMGPSVRQDGTLEEGKATRTTESTLTEIDATSYTASPETSISSEPVVPSDNSPSEDTQEEELMPTSGDSKQVHFALSTGPFDTSSGQGADLVSSESEHAGEHIETTSTTAKEEDCKNGEQPCDDEGNAKKEAQPGALADQQEKSCDPNAEGGCEKTRATVDELEHARDCNADVKKEGQPDGESVADKTCAPGQEGTVSSVPAEKQHDAPQQTEQEHHAEQSEPTKNHSVTFERQDKPKQAEEAPNLSLNLAGADESSSHCIKSLPESEDLNGNKDSKEASDDKETSDSRAPASTLERSHDENVASSACNGTSNNSSKIGCMQRLATNLSLLASRVKAMISTLRIRLDEIVSTSKAYCLQKLAQVKSMMRRQLERLQGKKCVIQKDKADKDKTEVDKTEEAEVQEHELREREILERELQQEEASCFKDRTPPALSSPNAQHDDDAEDNGRDLPTPRLVESEAGKKNEEGRFCFFACCGKR